MNKIKMTNKEFNQKTDTQEIFLMEKDVCRYNNKRYSIESLKTENNVVLTELPPKPIMEIE